MIRLGELLAIGLVVVIIVLVALLTFSRIQNYKLRKEQEEDEISE
jgi:choline-glycine betaine transporter